ncbi:hypothetical protein PUNSTDRAFT_53962 [Punctularia strigosozonata HHB-11173 SS5]|uniref:uncharacterized protein n=1 Tax=Punctularia strigosozonata (strain HHB-11173) TaxID=741275 RepID=UPI00044177F5|nr:uncharacterized protein PUNSTDRAFT_53962 [Punctularia strigosozonata HHB-11173 SS5]EIN06523.1 hypothetical protein PUNSTDRAFT_53962 [Punctularia strigosozonata HHB-11173 SS5]
MDVEFLTTFILSLMKSIDIRSESAVKLLAEFLDMDTPYVVGARHTNAEHFAHELYSYIRSPYRDLYVYDDVVQYDVSEEVPPPPVHQARSSRWQHEPEPGPSRRLGYLSPRVRDDYESPRARSTGESPLRSPASSISSRERSRDSLRHYRRSSISGGRVCQGKARGYDDEHEDQRLAREYGLDERTPGEESQRARTRARSRSRSRPSASRDCPEQRVPREPENHDTPIVTARDKGKHRATEAPQAEVGASPNDGVPVGSLPTPSLHSTPNEPSPKVAHGNPAPRTRPFRLKDLVQAHLGTAPAISRTTRSKTSSLQRAVSDTATEPSITPQSHAPSSAPVDETETSPHRSESTLTTKGAAGVSASLSAPQIMARTRARLAALRNESVAGVQPSAYSQKPEDTSSQSHEGPDHPFGNPPTDESGDTSVNPASKSVDMARRRLLNKLVREKRDLRSSVHTGLSPPATSALTEGNQGDSSGIGEGNETGDASAAMEARLRNEALLHVRLAAEKRVAASAGRAGQTHVNGFQGSSALAGSREEALKARLHERRR